MASGCRAGDFAGAMLATLALDRDAAMAGATLLERHSFVELFGEATMRMLMSHSAERTTLVGARRLFVSLRQALRPRYPRRAAGGHGAVSFAIAAEFCAADRGRG